MIRLLLVLLLVGCGGGGGGGGESPQAAQVTQPLAVYLFLGQSNMVGNGDPADLPPSLKSAQPAVIYSGGGWSHVTPGSTFGPEMSFASVGEVGIVKVAVSGTSLAVDWSGPLIQRAISEAKAAAASRPVRFAGVFWMQGESDAMRADWSTAYGENLKAMVSRLRGEIGNVPFTACRIVIRDDSSTFSYKEVVRQAQMNPGIENYHWMDCDGLTQGKDGLHFDSAGLVQMGMMFADRR